MKDNRTEIDDESYKNLYDHEVERYQKSGMWLMDARRCAAEILDSIYIRREAAMQCDTQKDYDDQRQGDWTR